MPLGKGPAAALTKQELETEGALSMTEEMPPLMEALNDMYVFYFTFFFMRQSFTNNHQPK